MKQSVPSRCDGFPKHRYRIALMGVLLMVVLAFGAFSFTPAAHAATSMQTSSSVHAAAAVPDTGYASEVGAISYAWSVLILGYNQYGNLAETCLNITNTPPHGNVKYNWWWAGPLWVAYYHSSSANHSPYNCPSNASINTSCWYYSCYTVPAYYGAVYWVSDYT